MSYCIVIPNYNHTHSLDDLLQNLSAFDLPILMINDGSNNEACSLFNTLETQYQCLNVIHHSNNKGKGAAVKSGLKAAYSLGYSHAVQIDADGQHDVNDIAVMMKESLAYPKAMISGKPVYDDSIPKHRFYARNITHFWVWVETLSFQIKDTMCGFRVYPLAATKKLLDLHSIGDRMDFDIEIMVKMFWENIDTRFIPTSVQYPEHGISHFRPFDDNVLISWMHTRLFFGMLIRIPKLLINKFHRRQP